MTEEIKKTGKDGTALATYVRGIFESFKTARLPFEETWAECWYNFLGQYQPEKVWKQKTEGRKGRSKLFVRLTTVKCRTAHAKISDVLFMGRNVMPFDVEALEPEMFGVPPEAAADASERMKKRLKDHFKKISLKKKMDVGILEMAIFGTAVLKGPIITTKRVPRVKMRTIGGMLLRDIDPEASPYEIVRVEETVPDVDRVSIWNYYVDPHAPTPADSIGEIHFERILPARFKELAYQGGYDAEAVMEAAERAKKGDEDDKTYVQLGDNYTGENGVKDEKVSILEYWGLVPVSMLRDAGCGEIPEDVAEDDAIEALVVLAADGVVIKACVNPIGRRPFYVCPYKEKPGQIYGAGVAEDMRDSQKMVNSSARLYVDNKALSGNLMTAVNLDKINTKRTKDLSVYPGKTWYVKGQANPREAIDAVAFPDVTFGIKDMIEMFTRFADDETGIPKYSSGGEASFLNKTATGMSMLITQSNIGLKSTIENIDDHWIEPMVEAFGDFFNAFGGGVNVPLRYKATGADSLVAKEIKMEQYMKFMQITSNPQDAIFMDRPKMMRSIARLLETEDVMRSDDEIGKIMKEMGRQATQPKDWREVVSIDRLYPMLARSEQVQILAELGIQPDMQAINNPPQSPLTLRGDKSVQPPLEVRGGAEGGGVI
jgi:hypothetical protein